MPVLTPRRLIGLTSLLLLVTVSNAKAQDLFLPNNTTLDATTLVDPPFAAIVGFANFDDYINGVNATSPTILIIDGASVNALEVHNSSLVNMSGGTVGNAGFAARFLTSDTSTTNISGGRVDFDLDMQNSSTVNFLAGTIGDDIITHDNVTLNMSGGTVEQDLLLNGDSITNLSGGTVLDEIFVQDNSLLNIFGTGLMSDLLDPDFQGFYSEYALTGQLTDNTVLANRIIFIQNGSGARFTLNNSVSAVPEPGTLAFLTGITCGGGQWLLRRKQRRCRTTVQRKS